MSFIKFCYYKIVKVNVELMRETVGMTDIRKRVFYINTVRYVTVLTWNSDKCLQNHRIKKIRRKQMQLNVCNSKYQRLSVF